MMHTGLAAFFLPQTKFAKAGSRSLESAPNGAVKLLDHHHSFINGKRCNECSEPLELVQVLSHRHWLRGTTVSVASLPKVEQEANAPCGYCKVVMHFHATLEIDFGIVNH
jgi:hypothetical protein